MPIDPRIPLTAVAAPGQTVNPLALMTQVLQGQKVASELRGLRQSEADQAAIRRVLQATGGDIQAALPELIQIAPGAGLELRSKLAEESKHRVDAARSQYELRSKAFDTGIRVLQTIVDEPSFQVGKRMLATLSPEVDQALGDTYDPANVDALMRAGLSAKEIADQQRDALKLLTEGKATEAVGTFLGTTRNQEEVNQVLSAAGRFGIPSEVLELFGPTEWSPENVQRWRSIAIGPTKEAELAKGDTVNLQQKDVLVNGRPAVVNFNPRTGESWMMTPSGRVDVSANLRPIPPQTPLQLVSVVGPDGKPVLVPESQAVGRTPGSAAVPPGDWSPKQVATFNQIAGAYERSPLIRAADRTIVLRDAARAAREDPKNATHQLSLGYAFIQALDTYQSAVREGELGNLGMLGTRWQQLGVDVNRIIASGAFLPPEVAKQIADSADQLIKTIDAGRQQKQREFRSRASVSGVGEMWDQFIEGAQAPPRGEAGADPLGIR